MIFLFVLFEITLGSTEFKISNQIGQVLCFDYKKSNGNRLVLLDDRTVRYES